MKLEKLNKKALYCMYLVTSIVCVVIAAVLGVIVFFTRTEAFTSNKTIIRSCRSAAFIKSKFLPVRLTACLALPKLKSLLPAET